MTMTISQALEPVLETAGMAFTLLGVTMFVFWIGVIVYNVVTKLWWNRG